MTGEPQRTAGFREAVGRCLAYQELVDTLCAHIRDLVGHGLEDLKIAILDPEDEEFYFLFPRSEESFSYYGSKSRRTNNLVGFGLECRDALILKQSDLGQFMQQHRIQSPAHVSGSVLLVPIRQHNRTVGVLEINLSPGWQGNLKALREELQAAAELAGEVLGKCHRYELTRQELKEQSTILQISASLQSHKTIGGVAEAILEAVTQQLGFDRAVVALVDKATGTLQGTMTRGHDTTYRLINYPVASSTDVLAEVVRTCQTQFMKDIRSDERIPMVIRERHDIWQAVYLPLTSKGEAVGVLAADHKKNLGQVTAHRLKTLEIFAAQASLAIENARLYQAIEQLAETDALTGVFNRYSFDKALKRQPLSLLMIDIRGFKRINDLYGHLAGDEILKDVARLLSEIVRDTDTVSRYGGDEFVVLMPNTNEEQASLVRERIEKAIDLRNQFQPEASRKFTLTIGLKVANAFNVDSILADADKAMYVGKEDKEQQDLLGVLTHSDPAALEQWDHFLASVLKVLYDKEPYFYDHSRRVMNYVVKICQLLGLERSFMQTVAVAALLHDIGKISINTRLLTKPAPLTDEEYRIIKTHPAAGSDLLRNLDYMGDVREIVLHHHERFDGKTSGTFPGYPRGLKGKGIPIGARILKVADSYDAMTSLRPYRVPISSTEAIRELKDNSSKAFDPEAVDVFVAHLKDVVQSVTLSFAMDDTKAPPRE
jgi:diguanylate cyclase (GGDEF)-like protein/putative nucleotidyltransferase with HDIG domain